MPAGRAHAGAMKSLNMNLCHFTGCVHTGDLPSKAQSIKERDSAFSSTDVFLESPNGFNYGVRGIDNTGLNREHCQRSDKDGYCRLDTLHTTSTKSTHGSPKSNSGALRYALHLRFLCPSSRKCLKSMQRCVSDPFSVPQRSNLDIEGERRFYLYNDLRVVFPQRHSDADEGKVWIYIFFSFFPLLTRLCMCLCMIQRFETSSVLLVSIEIGLMTDTVAFVF